MGGRAKRLPKMVQSSTAAKLTTTKAAKGATSKPPGLPKPPAVVPKVCNAQDVVLSFYSRHCRQRHVEVSSVYSHLDGATMFMS